MRGPSARPPVIVVMGVSAAGKSVVGAALARRLGAPFLDGDEFHPLANKDKMREGIALTDDDRWPWLNALGCALGETARKNGQVVGACSALRRSYRDHLRTAAGEPILFAFLHGDAATLEQRIRSRRHEYMNPALLASQLATLEPPTPDENAIPIDIGKPVAAIVHQLSSAIPGATHLYEI